MLYKKNQTPKLDMELFKNPTSEYRGTPFWAWNCQLDEETLTEQIEYLKQMGFGGFHMHSRSGMATKYLSDEFMDLVKTCVKKAKEENMLAWLYDEDRWPSGSAGGIVTKNKKFRQKFLHFSKDENPDAVSKEQGIEKGLPYLLSCYDILLNAEGELDCYRQIAPDETANGDKWYAYICTEPESGWYNDQTYLDTLSKDAVDAFIKATHETYKKEIGEDFGNVVPAIFTDEPNFRHKIVFPYAKGCSFASMPWTTDLEKSYFEKYNIDLVATLPELFWNLPNQKPSQARYFFHDHVAELFASSFMDTCSDWCRENGIAQTGHVLGEEFLHSQNLCVGEAMRTYRSMGIPGIDVLCNFVELSTAKQTQSVVHQYGREAMLSELYGVTNWDFDLRSHKFQGDWQAALGVTVRVPHLSWVSMKGSAKRDYPATFNYQIPWYQEYSYIENHFARLNTALTRGKPVVSVGVIHPIESDWLYLGPANTNSDLRHQMEDNFENIIHWLLFGLIDFDFISESLLSEIGSADSNRLKVGQMQYSTIIVPGCDTMRRTTLEQLKTFRKNGGKLIFCGSYPKYIDAMESNEGKALYEESIQIPSNRYGLLDALQEERFLEIKNTQGNSSENLIHAIREDGDVRWVFIARGKQDIAPAPFHAKNLDVAIADNLQIRIRGEWVPTLFDTISGETKSLPCHYDNGDTIIPTNLYENDSLLLQLLPGKASDTTDDASEKILQKEIRFYDAVSFKKDEPNVYLLDLAEYALDDGESQPMEEVLRIDQKCRKILDFPAADGRDTQPWVLTEQDEISHFVTLHFTIKSDITSENLFLAAEEVSEITWNNESVPCQPVGYYVDKSIKTYSLPALKQGANELLVKVPFGKRISIEAMYLLGDFHVSVSGCRKYISAPSEKLYFDDITKQGLPFFGGKITYCTEFEAENDCSAEILVGKYRGGLVKILLDGEDIGKIIFPPYKLPIKHLKKGKHQLEFVYYGNRVNTFSSMHNYGGDTWYGPGHWYAEDEKGFCYEYCLKECGILISPTVKLFS